MPIGKVINEGIPVKIWTQDIEESALQQLTNISKMPFIHHHVAVMPDVHYGIGATIGSVIPTRGAIIPSAVGVDIGCGMNAVRLTWIAAKDLPDNLKEVRHQIERDVPVGFNVHKEDRCNHEASKELFLNLAPIIEKHPKLFSKRLKNPYEIVSSQLGSLGGGNHFIEICLDESDNVWVMLHSGSRGIGNAIGQYFIELAKEDMRKYFINLPDMDLSYLVEGTEHFNDYVQAVNWAQDYAKWNRAEMMSRILKALAKFLPPFTTEEEAINCHHNYISHENHYGANVYVTRKGAIRAREGELGIIPGSMGAKSFIVRGKGNEESFNSCSHGAGRKMGRKEAERQFTIEDIEKQTEGIECRKDSGVIDEIPAAYKSIDEVMENQSDLIEVVHTLKQVINVKG